MLKRKNDNSKISSFTIGNNISLSSIETFRKELEKEYFAEVSIGIIDCDELGFDFVIEFQWNISLVEFLNQVRKRNIGQVNRINVDDFQEVVFSNALEQLRTQNVRFIGLDELHFSLSDCEINIRKIYPNSIEDQLGNIYKMLERHHMHFTSANRIQPSEIFIPVHEENLLKSISQACGMEKSPSSKRDYFNFWGIYFSHNDDAVIYDLSKRSIISGDLYMLGE